MRRWIGRREQTRRLATGGLLGDLLEPGEERLSLGGIAPAVDDVAEVDAIWYVRGKVAFLFEVEWTAMLGETLLRRHARIPPSEDLIRFLVIAPERAELVRYKLDRSPLLRAALESGTWHIVQSDQLRAFLARDPLDLADLEPYLGLEPTASATSEQMPLFRRSPEGDGPRGAVGYAVSGTPSATTSRALQGDETVTLPDTEPTPVDALADRFWESILELIPTTATFYGDERYADRLEDPGPAGRARTRALMERTAAEAGAIDTAGLPTEDRITRDMLKVIAELQIEEDDQHLYELQVVDQMGGPQQLLPQLTQFQPADTPERLEAFIARLHAYPAFMAANVELLRDGLASGLTAPRIVAERTIAQVERMLAGPDRVGDRAVDGQGRLGGRSRTRPRRRPRRRLSRPTRASSTRSAATTSRRPARSPASGRRPNGEALYRTAIRSWTTLDLDPEEVHRIGLEELETIEAERRVIARAAGFGDDTAGLSRGARRRRRQHPARRRTSSSPARPRTSSARMAVAPRYFGVLPRAECEVRAGRGVQGEGRALRLLLPAGAGRLAARHLLRQRLRPAEPHVHRRSRRRPTTRRRPATTSRSPSRWRTRTSTPSGGSARGWSAAPTSRAGACTASGSPTRWACSATRRERFGMLDAQAWRAARLVVDTGLHALRWPRQRSIDFLKLGRADRDRRGHRDRPLHRLAGPGPDLQDRPARDRAAARAS